MWPKNSQDASWILHGDLDMAFPGEARSWICCLSFEEGTPDRVVPNSFLMQGIKTAIDHQAIEISTFRSLAKVPRQQATLSRISGLVQIKVTKWGR